MSKIGHFNWLFIQVFNENSSYMRKTAIFETQSIHVFQKLNLKKR